MRDKNDERDKETAARQHNDDAITSPSALTNDGAHEANDEAQETDKPAQKTGQNVEMRESYKPNDPNTQVYLCIKWLQSWSPLITVIISTLALAVIVSQVVVYRQQASIMEQQRIVLDKQVEEMRRSVREAVITRETENRAYVNVLGGEVILPIKTETVTAVNLIVQNTGKIPAHNVEDRINCRFVAQDSGTIVPAECSPPSRGTASAILPSGTQEMIRVSITPMTESQLAMLADGKIHVVMSGSLVYQDNFNLITDPTGQPLPSYQDPFCFAIYSPKEKLLQPCKPDDWKWAALMMR